MSFDADCDEFIKNKLFRSKGKCGKLTRSLGCSELAVQIYLTLSYICPAIGCLRRGEAKVHIPSHCTHFAHGGGQQQQCD